MPVTGLTLNASASVVLDDNGDGIASAGPILPGVNWQPSTVAVSVSTNVAEAQCSVFVGISPAASALLGATQTGSSGDSTDCAVTVWPGQELIAVWTGGDAGSVATMSIFGTLTVPGDPPPARPGGG